jgi:hypothetical protein
MRVLATILALMFATPSAGNPVHHGQGCPKTVSRDGGQRPSEFAANVRPILEQHCKPCHFAGGKMYDKLPFDRPETITKLGEKLFTRIKNEDERAVIRKFLASEK